MARRLRRNLLRQGANATAMRRKTLTSAHSLRPNPRNCPRCGALGILPLAQPSGPNGEIANPVMLCPVCVEEFRADGVTWLGTFPLPQFSDASDEEVEAWADQVAGVLVTRAAGTRADDVDLTDTGPPLDVYADDPLDDN